MTVDVWNRYVLVRLQALLAVFPPVIADQEDRNIVPRAMDGTLEWTLPWGMDDGNGNVRLTLVEADSAWGRPKRVRVVVSAKAAKFSDLVDGEVPLPRYNPDAPPAHNAPKQTTAGRMAEYLLEHTGGDVDSLRVEADGSRSFTVAVA
jgi:hypothetical protein